MSENQFGLKNMLMSQDVPLQGYENSLNSGRKPDLGFISWRDGKELWFPQDI